MFKQTKGFVSGFLLCAIIAMILGTATAATSSQDVTIWYRDIKLVVDGIEVTPRDGGGNIVEPFIFNGTTYLPVRAVANAISKEVYWDGPNSIVYLGDMGGKLEYPSLKLEDAENIGNSWGKADTSQLTDNYGNRYTTAMRGGNSNTGLDHSTFQALLNMKYSRFRATVFVQNGTSSNQVGSFKIEADGKTIYSSPEINKTTAPIFVDVDIRGYNDFKIVLDNLVHCGAWFGDAGFYQ